MAYHNSAGTPRSPDQVGRGGWASALALAAVVRGVGRGGGVGNGVAGGKGVGDGVGMEVITLAQKLNT